MPTVNVISTPSTQALDFVNGLRKSAQQRIDAIDTLLECLPPDRYDPEYEALYEAYDMVLNDMFEEAGTYITSTDSHACYDHLDADASGNIRDYCMHARIRLIELWEKYHSLTGED